MKRFTILILSVFALALTVTLAASDKARELKLQQAIDLIESKGDLAKATPLFEDVAMSSDRALAARGLLHLAQAQERYGKGDALATYQRIVNGFGGATETTATGGAVAAARTKVAALEQKSSGLTATQAWDHGAAGVSPDGKYLLFRTDDTGDLALRDLTSGRNQPLTTGGKWNDRFAQGGVFSPDSRRIAYGWFDKDRSGFELRVIGREGGQPRAVYSAKEASGHVQPWAWIADGNWILTTLGAGMDSRSPRDLVMVSADTSAVRPIKHFTGGFAGNFSLSPDGQWVAYDRPVNPGSPRRGLFSLSIDTAVEVPMLADTANSSVLGWFPTSERVLFASDRGGAQGIWASTVVAGRAASEPVLVHAATGNVRAQGFTKRGDFYYSSLELQDEVYVAAIDPGTGRQASPPARLPSRFVGLKLQAAWSPTGDRLAFVQEPLTPSFGPMRDQKLAIQSIATGEVRLLPVSLQNLQNPAWLPDGHSVVVQGRGPDGQQGLHVVNVETGAVTTIVSRTAADDSRRSLAAPSPDGRRVFFRSAAAASATDAGGIGMLTLASGAAQNVASQAVRVFALSPDGQWLALTGSEPRDGPIAIIPSAGGASRPMAPVLNSWSVLGPIAWSSDGRFVFVVKFVVKSGVAVREVWQVPFDGTEPRDTGIRLPGDVSRISAHPDGRRLAISMEVASAETWVLQNIPPVRGEK